MADSERIFKNEFGDDATLQSAVARPTTLLLPMRLGGSELIVIVLILIPTVWALFDALQTSSDAWAASKQDQAVWVLVVVLLPVIGALLFFLVARPRLNQAR